MGLGVTYFGDNEPSKFWRSLAKWKVKDNYGWKDEGHIKEKYMKTFYSSKWKESNNKYQMGFTTKRNNENGEV